MEKDGNTIKLISAGTVKNNRSEMSDDYWGGIISTISLNPNVYAPDATEGLDKFSHIEVVFYMNRVKPEKISTDARHPRNDTSLPKIGILAQRGKNRPNMLGISRAKIIEVKGLDVVVEGLDAINGTPVLDIKPYTRHFIPLESVVVEPAWLEIIMRNYYLVNPKPPAC